MKYIAIAKEKGYTYDGCNGGNYWIRFVHIITANTRKELEKQKENIKKIVSAMSNQYVKVYLCEWRTLEEYNEKNK